MAILGISGKIGSGKDTTGKIIQYLSVYHDAGYRHPITEKDYNSFHNNHHTSDWQIKKFAYAVKQVCSILTGIPIEDFEKEEVKNRVLGEEWIRYGYADGFIKKYIGNGEMGQPIMNNKQCSKEKYEEEYRINWQTAYKQEYTVRNLLQIVGTDLIRNQLHSDAWVNALMSQYKSKRYTAFADDAPIRGFPTEEDEVKYGKIVTEYPNWIITDVRFPNEAQAIKDRGGFIIRVNRNDYIFNDSGKRIIPTKEYTNISVNQHPSETALDDYDFTFTIDNNGSLTDLIHKVNDIMITTHILDKDQS